MDEWENPNPIMLSERAAQRSAAQTRAPSSSSHRAKSQCAGGTLAACTECTLVPFCGRGLLGGTLCGRVLWRGIKVSA